ncbi:MAG: CBS domain-containing protein [Sandaracinaceae bacterium]|nr:CBS domain-containing protein [Sandaracinaceae bacterium]
MGLVSSWDIARYAIERGSAALRTILAADAMERKLVRLHPKATLREAAEALADGGFHSLPSRTTTTCSWES